MAQKGSKRVEVFGIDDKRQITATFAASLSGNFLPIQLIYEGKTSSQLLIFQKGGILPIPQIIDVMNRP